MQSPCHAYCQRCSKHYPDKSILQEHYRARHYHCDICDQVCRPPLCVNTEYSSGFHPHGAGARLSTRSTLAPPSEASRPILCELQAHIRGCQRALRAPPFPPDSEQSLRADALRARYLSGARDRRKRGRGLRGRPRGSLGGSEPSHRRYFKFRDNYTGEDTGGVGDRTRVERRRVRMLLVPPHIPRTLLPQSAPAQSRSRSYAISLSGGGKGCEAEFGTLSGLWQHMESERCNVRRFRKELEAVVEESLENGMRMLRAS